MDISTLTHDCLRSGVTGAMAAGVFGLATAIAMLSTGPRAVPIPASHLAKAPAAAKAAAPAATYLHSESGSRSSVLRYQS